MTARSETAALKRFVWPMIHEREDAEILETPYDEVMQVALIPVEYTIGTDFKPGKRKPLDTMLHWESW